MNKERLLQLATLLETDHVAKHFDMNYFFAEKFNETVSHLIQIKDSLLNKCGTVACIAGWAVAEFEPKSVQWFHEINEKAAHILDLEPEISRSLFTPSNDDPDYDDDGEVINPYEATAAQAAKVVRHLAETGVVDWSKAFD